MAITTKIQKRIQQLGADYTNIQTVRLGKLDGSTIQTGVAGMLWARQYNGKEIKVYNKALVSARFDLRVLVGISRTQNNRWVILDEMNDYLTPAGGGNIGPHAEQHMWGGDDPVWVDRKQIVQFTCLASGSFLVTVYGGILRVGGTFVELDTQAVDFSPYVVEAGACFVNLECSETGELSFHVGENFETTLNADATYIPIPEDSRVLICTVLMYESQPYIINDNIIVPMPVERGGLGGQTFSSIRVQEIHDQDVIGFYSEENNATRGIPFYHFKKVIHRYTHELYAILKSLSTFVGAAAGGDLSGTYPDPTVTGIQTVPVASLGSIADGETIVYNSATLQFEPGEAGGGGGSPWVYDDLTSQIPASNDEYALSGIPTGAVLVFWNSTLQTDFTLIGSGDTLALDFSPDAGDVLIAVFDTSGVIVEPAASPALRIYMNQNFTM